MTVRRWVSAVVLLSVAWLQGAAQLESQVAVTIHPRSSFLAGTGFLIPVRLQRAVDAGNSAVGDAVEFEATMNIFVNGKLVIPERSRLLGRIEETAARDKGNSPSRLSIRVDRAVWPGGSAQLHGYVAQIFRTADVSVKQRIERHADTSERTSIIHKQEDGRIALHPTMQMEASPGELPIGYESGRNMNENPLDNDLRLLALEDVDLRSDAQRGSVLVSSKKNVRLERRTYLVLRTRDIACCTVAQNQ